MSSENLRNSRKALFIIKDRNPQRDFKNKIRMRIGLLTMTKMQKISPEGIFAKF